MDPSRIAERKALAQDRSAKALEKLAKTYKLDISPAALQPTGRDPALVSMLKDEAIADILEAIASKARKPEA